MRQTTLSQRIKIFKQSFIGKMIVYAIFWSNPTAHISQHRRRFLVVNLIFFLLLLLLLFGWLHGFLHASQDPRPNSTDIAHWLPSLTRYHQHNTSHHQSNVCFMCSQFWMIFSRWQRVSCCSPFSIGIVFSLNAFCLATGVVTFHFESFPIDANEKATRKILNGKTCMEKDKTAKKKPCALARSFAAAHYMRLCADSWTEGGYNKQTQIYTSQHNYKEEKKKTISKSNRKNENALRLRLISVMTFLYANAHHMIIVHH